MPHSCGHRSCPHRQHYEAKVWIERQTQLLVPATYFMLTQLRGLAWGHQRVAYALLDAVRLGHAPHLQAQRRQARRHAGRCGGAAHPHSRRLEFHPHVHMMMPAAALDAGRKLWRTKVRRSRRRRGKSSEATPATGGYLFNHKALAKVFRAKVLDAFERAGLPLPAAVPTTWVVDCRAVGDGQKALLYLGRYLYRGAISESDILRCDAQGRVTFQYRDSRTGKTARRTLPGEDFLWLLLQHVLPKGLRRSRNFGFLHPNCAGAIRLLQLLHVRAAPPGSPAATTAARPAWRSACGQPMIVLRRRLPALQCDGSAMNPRARSAPASAPSAAAQPHVLPDKPGTATLPTMH